MSGYCSRQMQPKISNWMLDSYVSHKNIGFEPWWYGGISDGSSFTLFSMCFLNIAYLWSSFNWQTTLVQFINLLPPLWHSFNLFFLWANCVIRLSLLHNIGSGWMNQIIFSNLGNNSYCRPIYWKDTVHFPCNGTFAMQCAIKFINSDLKLRVT